MSEHLMSIRSIQIWLLINVIFSFFFVIIVIESMHEDTTKKLLQNINYTMRVF